MQDDRRPRGDERRRRQVERTDVVQRTARQPEVVAREAELHKMREVLPRQVGVGEHHALRPAGGARRVHQPVHVVAGRDRARDRRRGRAYVGQRLPSVRCGGCDAQPGEVALESDRRLAGELEQVRVADQRPGPGVLQDVAHLRCGQSPVDRHRDRPEVVRGEERLEELGTVVGEQRDDVTAPHPALVQPGREPGGAIGHRAVRDGRALENRERLVRRSGRVVGENGEPVDVCGHLGDCAHVREYVPTSRSTEADPSMPTDAAEGAVRYDVHGRVAVITLNRPEARNAVNREVAVGLENAIDRLEADPDVWVAVLCADTGEQERPVFCAGADLKVIQEAGDASPLHTERGGFAGFVFRDRTKPVVAAVDGLAVAGGLEIALASDIVVATTRSAFGLPEVKRNLVAAAGGLYRLPRAVGTSVAMDVILTGEPITARRAYDLGLVSRLVEPEEAVDEAMRVAAQIVESAPLAVRASRRVVRAALDDEEDQLWAVSA